VAGSGGVAVAGNGGFVAALSSLQAASIPSQPPTAIDPQNLKAATHQQLVDFKQQNQHQVNSADGQTIDVVSMLFDFFFDDEALPAPIKVLIGRLQIPILKVAILDKEFFNQKKHPARKLLDSISRASLGWGDNNKDQAALIEKIEEVVNFLINEFGRYAAPAGTIERRADPAGPGGGCRADQQADFTPRIELRGHRFSRDYLDLGAVQCLPVAG
jgi:hypothetical protein